MAVLYVKAAGGNWSAAGTWSTTGSGGGDSSGPPTAATDCIAEAGSGALTINSAAACRSFNTTSGTGNYAALLTHNSGITWTVGDGTAGAGNVAIKFNASMSYNAVSSSSSATTLASTSATQQSVTTAGFFWANFTINGTGSSYILIDTLETSGTFTYTAGSAIDTTTNSAIIKLNSGSATFTSGGKTYFSLSFTGASGTLNGGGSYGTLTKVATAAKTNSLTIGSNITVTAALVIAGNSAVNRLLVKSTTLGTPITITNAGATMTWSNVDFRDIALGTTFDATAITGKSGDCGGNTNITFTPAATQTWSGTSGGTWSGNAWSGRVPLPQDDATISSAFSASQTVTNDMPRMGNSISFSGASGAPTFALNTASQTIYGSLTYALGMSVTATQTPIFEGRTACFFTPAGLTLPHSLQIQMIGGSLTLLGALISTGSTGLVLNNGTFDASGFSVQVSNVAASGTLTRVLTMGSGTWSLTAASGSLWTTAITTGLTFSGASAIIALTDNGNSAKTFSGGGLTFKSLAITGGGTGAITISGDNTWSNLPQVTGGTKTLTMTSGAVQTFTGGTDFGNSTNVLTISAAATSTFTKPSGANIRADYLSLTKIAATQASKWYAGTHSTDGGNNTNWVFTADPTAVGGSKYRMLLGVG